MACFGICFIIRKRFNISTDEAIAFSKIKNFIVGVNRPKTLNISGKITEIMMKGAIVMKIYLDLDISSSVMTNPPNRVIPTKVLSDFLKFGMKIK